MKWLMVAIALAAFCPAAWGQKGLVGYYPFNGNANDESINGNHMQVNGPVLAADRFGRQDSAYSFDGVDDFMRIPFNPSLKPASLGTAVWVRISKQPDHGKYILTSSGDEQTPPFDPFRLRVRLSRHIVARYEGNENTINLILESSTVLDLDRWYFIATYYDAGTGEAALFINGKLEDRIVAEMTLDTNELDWLVGASQLHDGTHDSTAFFAGEIDDIRIFNRALTPQEISAFFTEGAPTATALEILDQNFPNPFNQGTTIRYVLSAPAKVVVRVYNVTGQVVQTIADGLEGKGEHHHRWDGRDGNGREVSSGLYIYRVVAGNQSESRKMLLIR